MFYLSWSWTLIGSLSVIGLFLCLQEGNIFLSEVLNNQQLVKDGVPPPTQAKETF